MFNKAVKDDNPVKYIFEHILKGDASDGVPNVLSPDDCLVNSVRQSPMTKKKLAEWWENRADLKSVMPTEVFRNYMRNREMIDLHRTPKHMVEINYFKEQRCQHTHSKVKRQVKNGMI